MVGEVVMDFGEEVRGVSVIVGIGDVVIWDCFEPVGGRTE